jgi:hypothetical protein
MDHGFSRDKQPWEFSEGAYYLLKELAPVDFSVVEANFDLLEDMCRIMGVD